MPPTKRQVVVIGQQWVVDPHNKHPCPRCRELNGREYYINPKSGQRSVDEIPRQPLHPNCRCKLEPILGYPWDLDMDAWLASQPEPPATAEDLKKDQQFKPVFSEEDKRDGITIMGVVLGNDKRPITSGPTYGYYGGLDWTKGQDVTGKDPGYVDGLSKPEDDPNIKLDAMDEAFKQHDDGYTVATNTCKDDSGDYGDAYRCQRAKKLEADRILVAELERIRENNLLEKDLDKLGRTPKQKEYAERYLRFAYWYFDGKIADADRRKDVAH